MIKDELTGIIITPGDGGRDCNGGGYAEGNCCCDECDAVLTQAFLYAVILAVITFARVQI